MRTLVIVAHPSLHEGSRVNRMLREALREAEEVTVHELYQTYPDDQIDVEREQKLLLAHDRIILQFPLWWYSSPYLLKKWFDDVLAFGWAYGTGGDKLKGKQLGLAISTGGAAGAFQAGGYNQFSMSELVKPIQATSNLIGTVFMPMFVTHGAMDSPDEELQEIAGQYVRYVCE